MRSCVGSRGEDTARQAHERQRSVASLVLKAVKRGFSGFTQIYADFVGRNGFSWTFVDFSTSQSA